MTDMATSEGRKVENEISIARQDNQLSDDLKLPMGSFLSIDSEQSSNKEEDKYVTPITNRVKILKFEDTLADEDCRQFRIIVMYGGCYVCVNLRCLGVRCFIGAL